MIAAVASPTNSVAGCSACRAAAGPAASRAGVMPVNGLNWAMMINADAPHMNPAMNGYGT